MNISPQMRLVLLDAVTYAISRNHLCCKSDGFGNEVDLSDAKDFLEAEAEKDRVLRPVGRKGSV